MALTSAEKKTIQKTVTLSLVAMILIIAGTWFFQYTRHKSKHERLHREETYITSDNIIPLDFTAHAFAARRFMETEQPRKALPHIKRALSIKPNNRTMLYALAMASFEVGAYDHALAALTRLEHTGTEDTLTPKICALKGIALFNLGRKDESREQLESCLARFPRSAAAACYLGQIKAMDGKGPADVLTYFHRALELDSLYVEGWYQLARYTMQQGQYKNARRLLLQALEIDPLHVKCHSRLGMVYYYLREYELAKKSYLTALALNPRDFNTRYNLGELYFSAVNDREKALQEFTLALKQNPGHVEANFKTGLICLHNNMVKEAVRYFRRAQKSDPKNVRVLLQLAVAYEKLGDQSEALQTYKTVLAFDALNSIARQKVNYLKDE
ncbi:MAG: tetratricopeptide repeat protein [Chitinispirillaceae bacterium]|nr:tetratricopeptide repeat protein [Chitinispirillaceae bacterium]